MQAMDETNEEVAHLHAAIEHQGPNQQYAVLQTPAKYEGITFNLLIDSGTTHSFLSIASVCKMYLNPQNDTKFKVELATGKQTQSSTSVKNLNFKLGGQETNSSFRVLPLGIYDGILGMDWLIKNNATIDYKEKKLKFKTLNGEDTIVTGTRGDPKLHLVPATKLLKAYCKKQKIFVVKLNTIEKPKLVSKIE